MIGLFMVDGNSLYSFAARKANDLWPVANLHLGRFKSGITSSIPIMNRRTSDEFITKIGWRLVV